MAWNGTKVFGAGEVLTAADLNTYVSNNLDYLKTEADTVTGALVQLDASTSTVQVVNTTTETTIYTFTVAANKLGTDKMIMVKVLGDAKNNRGANSELTLRLKYGTTTLASAVVDYVDSATTFEWSRQLVVAAKGATNVQRGAVFGMGTTTTAGAEDSTGALALTVTVQWEFADANTEFNKYYAIAYFG